MATLLTSLKDLCIENITDHVHCSPFVGAVIESTVEKTGLGLAEETDEDWEEME